MRFRDSWGLLVALPPVPCPFLAPLHGLGPVHPPAESPLLSGLSTFTDSRTTPHASQEPGGRSLLPLLLRSESGLGLLLLRRGGHESSGQQGGSSKESLCAGSSDSLPLPQVPCFSSNWPSGHLVLGRKQ